MASPTQARFPKGSLVLVTGVNGIIAPHVAEQFLAAGYRVRGTVRDKTKASASWVEPLFTTRYPSTDGQPRFEIAEVPDLSAPGAWNEAVRGVSGIAHVLGAYKQGGDDAIATAEAEMPDHLALLEAAKAESSVKSFVMTSSAWAAFTPDAKQKRQLHEWSWNDEAVAIAAGENKARDATEAFYAPWMTLKTVVEKKMWEYVRREDLPFAFNSVLPGQTYGPVLQPKVVDVQSTAGIMRGAYEGTNTQVLDSMEPQWCVDGRDVGLLFVAAMTSPTLNGRRLFAFGARYSWPRVVEILQGLFPQKGIKSLPDRGWDQTDVPNELAEELLKSVKGSSWYPLEETVEASAESF